MKIRCHGNKGWSRVNLNDNIKLAGPQNHILEPKITTLILHRTVVMTVERLLIFHIGAIVIFSNFQKKSFKYRIYNFSLTKGTSLHHSHV